MSTSAETDPALPRRKPINNQKAHPRTLVSRESFLEDITGLPIKSSTFLTFHGFFSIWRPDMIKSKLQTLLTGIPSQGSTHDSPLRSFITA
jgi:hypothetical protein